VLRIGFRGEVMTSGRSKTRPSRSDRGAGRKSAANREAWLHRWVKRIEHTPKAAHAIQWAVFGMAAVSLVYLQIVLYQHAGSFWRDETSSIQLARSNSLTEMWTRLDTDSFPALFVGLLRLWMATGLGASEAGIRLLGTTISLGLVAAMAISCRAFGVSLPLLAVALVGFNATVFYSGSSIRAYGLAAALIVLCFAGFWRLAERPSLRAASIALLLALLSVHANYQNCYLLLAIGIASAGVCAAARQWQRSLLVLGLCSLAAVSMLVYLPTILSYKDTVTISQFALDVTVIIAKLGEALAGDSAGLLMIWAALLALAAGCLVAQYTGQRRADVDERTPSPALYCLLTISVAGVAAVVFFKVNRMFPFPWHYIPFIALLGLLAEIALRSSRYPIGATLIKAVVSCAVVATSWVPLWDSAHLRRTNLDLVSTILVSKAGPRDLVLVSPFYLSPGFNYHYSGAAPWTTLPAIATDPISRRAPFGPFRRLMMTPEPLEPTLRRIQETLESGFRLWVVGIVQFPQPGTVPPHLPPAPHSVYGWNNNAYASVWSMELGGFLQAHANLIRGVQIQVNQAVNPLENLSLLLVEGWRGP